MKKLFFASIVLGVSCFIISCGNGDKKSSSVTINDIDYYYDDMTDSLRQVVTIESDECVIENANFGQTTSLVLECECSNNNDEKASKIAKVSNGTIALELLDKDDVEIGEMVLENSREVFDWLKTADLYAKKEFLFKSSLSNDIISKVKTIKYKYKGETSSTEIIAGENNPGPDDEVDANTVNDDENEMDEEGDENKNEDSSNKNDVSIDDLLREYEQFANDYIAFLKKVDMNDPSVTVEITKWANKQTVLVSKIEDVGDDMDEKQFNRFNKINIKIIENVKNLSKIKPNN